MLIEVRPSTDPARIRGMFDAISPRYDLLNHLLSAGIDLGWRRTAAAMIPPGARVLDLCCGTGDMALAAAANRACRVVGTDFAPRMTARARRKALRRGGHRPRPCFLPGDALRPAFRSGTFDAVTIAFGLRNTADPDRCLREMRRVLNPGGSAIILEFTLPEGAILRRLYLPYFTRVLPFVAGLISGAPGAYHYLNASVRSWPRPAELAERMGRAGFADVSWRLLDGGIAAIHHGTASV